ncbi:helix-turn-helix domain-containing protein [Pseudarthrobacter siccitolerans]
MSTSAVKLPASALPLFTVADAAKQFGVTPNYFYERIRDGRVTTVDIGTELKPKLRIRNDTLQALIEQHTTHAVSDAA